ncbi:Os07g0406400 [Oryza sativa Japonica Group]|uniref:Os07g0406400 protein n=2 Tax=Oryza sativa subsp. japonica TaxID=39947 RepID=Q7EYK8_ORYSJ|nr:hypothetical protein [Oryza sativa Japonica Group]BAT01094.1 Os07g0406400 [Oryza sativa Japonica Group]
MEASEVGAHDQSQGGDGYDGGGLELACPRRALAIGGKARVPSADLARRGDRDDPGGGLDLTPENEGDDGDSRGAKGKDADGSGASLPDPAEERPRGSVGQREDGVVAWWGAAFESYNDDSVSNDIENECGQRH